MVTTSPLPREPAWATLWLQLCRLQTQANLGARREGGEAVGKLYFSLEELPDLRYERQLTVLMEGVIDPSSLSSTD